MLSGVLIAIVCLPALLTFVWFSEVLAGCFALRKERTSPVAAPGTLSHRTTVLIPAHNEGAGILPTIRDVQAQLGPNDRILVVADNCTDDTAAIVHAAGVDVIVRADPTRRGKGYALEFGVRHLGLNPSDVVIIMDADCRLGENALRHLSDSAMASGRPVQSLYLMLAPENAPRRQRGQPFRLARQKLDQAAWLEAAWVTNSALRHRDGLPAQSALGPRPGKQPAGGRYVLWGLPSPRRAIRHFSRARRGSTVISRYRKLAASSSVSVGRRGISTILSIWSRGRSPNRCAIETLAWLRSPSTWRCLLCRCLCLSRPSARSSAA